MGNAPSAAEEMQAFKEAQEAVSAALGELEQRVDKVVDGWLESASKSTTTPFKPEDITLYPRETKFSNAQEVQAPTFRTDVQRTVVNKLAGMAVGVALGAGPADMVGLVEGIVDSITQLLPRTTTSAQKAVLYKEVGPPVVSMMMQLQGDPTVAPRNQPTAPTYYLHYFTAMERSSSSGGKKWRWCVYSYMVLMLRKPLDVMQVMRLQQTPIITSNPPGTAADAAPPGKQQAGQQEDPASQKSVASPAGSGREAADAQPSRRGKDQEQYVEGSDGRTACL